MLLIITSDNYIGKVRFVKGLNAKMAAPRFAQIHPAVRLVHGPARSDVFLSGKAQQALYFQEDIGVFLHNLLNFSKND